MHNELFNIMEQVHLFFNYIKLHVYVISPCIDVLFKIKKKNSQTVAIDFPKSPNPTFS